MLRVLLATLATLCVVVHCRAQARDEYGILFAGSANMHLASFSELEGVPSCCPEFTTTIGFGPHLGAFLTFPLNDRFHIQARLTYSNSSATLTDTEKSFVADLRDSARVVEAQFTHNLEASLAEIGVEPLVLFRAFSSLDVMLGVRVAMPLTSSFRQTETLTEPADFGAYLGAGRVYMDTTADIPLAVVSQIGIVTGLRYVVPLSASGATFIAPELQVHLPLTRISRTVAWSVAHIRLGLALGFTGTTQPPLQPPPPPQPQPQPTQESSQQPPARTDDASVATKTVPRVWLDVKGLDASGVEHDALTIHVEEIEATEIVPVLPHVFFEPGSATWIPAQRASRAAFDTNPESMPIETAIHAVPWLLAARAAANPGATIRLVGTGADDPSGKGLTLARARAQSVKDAFVARGVSAANIVIATQRQPSNPTVATDTAQRTLADAENRRVEIELSDPLLRAPFTLRSVERTIDPPSVKVNLRTAGIEGNAIVRSWTLTARQGDRQLASFSGFGLPPAHVQWRLADSGVPTSELPIELEVVLTSLDTKRVATASATVAVEQLTIQKKRVERLAGHEIERLNLLLFEFNDARVSPENARLIEDIRTKIRTGTIVTVYGQTDELGSAEYNRDLSLRRASEVARVLNMPGVRVIGNGEENRKYTSESPVTRGYNRTVIVELVTPVP